MLFLEVVRFAGGVGAAKKRAHGPGRENIGHCTPVRLQREL